MTRNLIQLMTDVCASINRFAADNRSPEQGDFVVKNGGRLRFRADFFNVFNHPQFGEAASDPTAPNFGRILRTSVNNRTVQLGLHVYF
jgi:hypothetical protein